MKVHKKKSRSNKRSWYGHLERAGNLIGTAYQYSQRHGGSSTKTKSHVERLKGDDVHSGVTDASYTVVIAKPKKSADYRASKNMYEELNGGRFVSSAGLQNCNTLTTIGTVSEWMVSTTVNANHFGTANIATALFENNPAQYGNGSVLYGSLSRVVNDMFYLASCNVKISVSNFSTLPVSCWIYCLVSKVDHNKSPSADWDQQDIIDGLGKGGPSFPAAGAQTGGAVGRNNTGIANNTPGNNATFRKLWGIKKVHRVNLAGAAQEDVDFHIRMNQIGAQAKFISQNPLFTTDPGTWTNGNIAIQYPRGSVAFMVVHRGAVVHDTTTGGDAVTFGASEVGYVYSKHYTMYPMKAKSNRFESKIAYPQIPFGATLADQKFVDIVDQVSGVEQA